MSRILIVMAFAKIDVKILDSSVWVDREIRDIFMTALLMATPYELKEPMPQLEIESLNETGFIVPPGWYGYIRAAGPGIIRRALMKPTEGIIALKALGEPDIESQSHEFDGRRLVRINHGFIVLNFMKYRDRDVTAVDRQRKLRQRKKQQASA